MSGGAVPRVLRAVLALAIGGVGAASGQDLALVAPVLAPVPPSTEGAFTLEWTVDEAVEAAVDAGRVVFEVEERLGGEAVTIPVGAHLSTALSGRDDGVYGYRVRARVVDGAVGAWSERIEVQVQHHPLWLAFTLFGVGAFVFVATAALVLGGHRRAGAHDPS